ncbi:type II secretion system F family protein [Streptomyces sp. JJ66]|uniref:type II secretion system F family protein n=1 Tax=Streptomyces sp. JJ66 TaxID=2803843 RepID=UPI001C59BC4D|nr:type II secretion system F family protein [Streptomyces sp. JJ66]MBW1603794.1 type II secretion system F family protein [Streptomyces sp. JJ66]
MAPDTMHSLWTAAVLAVAAALAAARLRTHRASRAVRRRRRTVLGSVAPASRPAPGRRVTIPASAQDAGVAAGAGTLAFLLVGGRVGTLAGLAAACAMWWWLRVRRAGADQRADAALEQAVTGQLPLTAQLLAACLAAGSSPAEAARAVGSCLGGPLGDRLLRTCDELRLGAEPVRAWARLAELPAATALARCLERAHGSGAPAVDQVERLAAECRARSARAAQARARRAGVLVTGPLALCFLPAFLLAGVTPVIVGLGRSLL